MATTAASTPACSVIIPAHNRARYLAATLTTLAQQQVPPGTFEAVVVDDGSTDGTPTLLAGRQWPFPLTCLRKDNHNSRAETRNLATMAARGQILIFLDAEMLCPPGFVQAHLDLHQRLGPCAVCGWHGRLQAAFPEPLPPDWFRRVPAPGRLDGCYPGYNNAPHLLPFITANASCLRADALEVGLFDQAFVGYGHEDLDMGMRLYLLGRRLYSDSSTMAYHQPHPRSRGLGEDVTRNSRYYLRKHHHRRHVVHISDYLVAGGIERFVIAVARRLHGRQHRFTWVVAHEPTHYHAELAELGVPVHQVPPSQIGQFLDENPADLIHLHTPWDWLEPLRQAPGRAPVIITVHFPSPLPPLPGVARTICVTDGLAHDDAGTTWHHQVIHPGTDPAAFAHRGRGTQARARFGLPLDAFVIGTAARMDETKLSLRMFDLYLELLRLNPRIHALLMGAGDNHPRFVELAALNGLTGRIHLPGTVDDVGFALEALDACVHAVEDEPFGIAILEALAKGLPVVCSDVLGPRVTIGETGAGFVCASGAELLQRVLELADGRHDLGAMRQRALATARLFDDRRTAFRYKLLYDEVVDGARYWWPPHSA